MSSLTPYNALSSRKPDELITLLQANPTSDTIQQLINAFEGLAPAHPEETDSYAAALVAVRDSGEIPLIKIVDTDGGSTSTEDFDGVLNRYIYHLLTALLTEPVDTKIQPTNKYIIASVLSGAAIHTDLCISSAQVGEITRGLHFKGSDHKAYFGPEKYEVNAIGACIQVLAGGQAILKADLIGKEELSQRIKQIEKYVSDPAGKRVLETTEKQAAASFNNPLTSREIWQILFPSS